jgi:hypothetical protein
VELEPQPAVASIATMAVIAVMITPARWALVRIPAMGIPPFVVPEFGAAIIRPALVYRQFMKPA